MRPSTPTPLLRFLLPQSAGEIFRYSVPISLARSTTIFQQGDPADGVYFVQSGKVKLARYLDNPERQSVLRLLGPGAMFGELSALDGGRRSSSAITVTATQLFHMPQHHLKQLLNQHPEVAIAFIRQLASRLRWSDLMVSSLTIKDVAGRIAATLVYFADHLGEQTAEGIEVRHDLTQSELAAMVGATRETVNRTLTDLVTRGIIDNGSRRVRILDLTRLKQQVL